jgi:flagellar hook assembly protein FlgD
VQALNETQYFVSDNHQGSIEAPVPFHLPLSGTVEAYSIQSFDIQPNPFSGETKFRFVLPQAEAIQLRIADMQGRIVAEYVVDAQTGLNVFSWDGKTQVGAVLQAGVYFVRLETGRGSVTRKVVLQR